MSIIGRLACNQGRADEVLNQELAKELAETENKKEIKEIAVNLWNKDKKIKSDCIKVLYEIGYIKPELISYYVSDFIKLLKNKNNRLVWGAMIALSTIAELKAENIYENLDYIYSVLDSGSVITIDNGIKVLAKAASKNKDYNEKIFPYLINHLKTCRPKEIPQHSESILPAVNNNNKDEFITTIKERESTMTLSQQKRISKLLKSLGDD